MTFLYIDFVLRRTFWVISVGFSINFSFKYGITPLLYTNGSQPVGRDPKMGRRGVSGCGLRTTASVVC